MKICSNGSSLLAKMPTMPIYGKDSLKIFVSRTEVIKTNFGTCIYKQEKFHAQLSKKEGQIVGIMLSMKFILVMNMKWKPDKRWHFCIY